MYNFQALKAALALVGPSLLGSCSFLYVIYTCPPNGECRIEGGVRGVFCPDGSVAPTPQQCPGQGGYNPPNMAGINLTFTATNGVTYTNTNGNVRVSIQGGQTLNTPWQVQNGKIVFASPTTVGNWIQARINPSQPITVDFVFEDAEILAPGTGSNQTVSITGRLKYNSTVLDTEQGSYVYYPPPPQAAIVVERSGHTNCGWLVTSLLSHPAYNFIIERKPTLGGSWAQTYSGADTCIPRSGSWIYRGVYTDIFGNRGPNSVYKTTNCEPGEIP